MNTNRSIKKNFKFRLNTKGTDCDKNSVQSYAKQLLISHGGSSTADMLHKNILKDVADGKSRSWDDVKKELICIKKSS
ncbi:MAG: hypothetical protein ACMXYK_03615 [Candidatus Woesearchaeota archaeon]